MGPFSPGSRGPTVRPLLRPRRRAQGWRPDRRAGLAISTTVASRLELRAPTSAQARAMAKPKKPMHNPPGC